MEFEPVEHPREGSTMREILPLITPEARSVPLQHTVALIENEVEGWRQTGDGEATLRELYRAYFTPDSDISERERTVLLGAAFWFCHEAEISPEADLKIITEQRLSNRS